MPHPPPTTLEHDCANGVELDDLGDLGYLSFVGVVADLEKFHQILIFAFHKSH